MDWLSGKNKILGPAKEAISLLLELGSQSGSTMTPTDLKEAISHLYGDRPGARRARSVGERRGCGDSAPRLD